MLEIQIIKTACDYKRFVKIEHCHFLREFAPFGAHCLGLHDAFRYEQFLVSQM